MLHTVWIVSWPILGVPVDFFDVVIFNNGQSIAAFGAAVFQDIAAVGSRHSGAEAVHSQAATDFRLVSTLGHIARFLSNNFKDMAPYGARIQ